MINSINNNGSSSDLVAEKTIAPLASRPLPPMDEFPPSASADEPSRPWRTRSVAALGIVLTFGLFTALAAATVPRIRNQRALDAAAAAQADALPRMTVATVKNTAVETDRELPGNAAAFLTTAVYGRTNGYLKTRLVDIGDRVHAGQLLGEIAAPELDAQLEEAKATLLQSKANLLKLQAEATYAKAEEGRYRPLLARGATTKESYEQKLAAWKMADAAVAAMEATIKVNEADIQRLSALQSFEKLTAPFNAVVTARNVDPGDLITADNPSTERQLFRVAQIDTLRVFVDVPQVFSTDIKPGQTALLHRREDPAHQYTGKVTRTANALDPNTRTLRTEVDVPNPTGALLPGMYLQVKFVFNRENPPVVIPTAAVVVRTGGPKVALLDARDTVHYRDVKLGRDFGTDVEVLTGLRSGERVVVYPGDDLPEGKPIQPATSN